MDLFNIDMNIIDMNIELELELELEVDMNMNMNTMISYDNDFWNKCGLIVSPVDNFFLKQGSFSTVIVNKQKINDKKNQIKNYKKKIVYTFNISNIDKQEIVKKNNTPSNSVKEK